MTCIDDGCSTHHHISNAPHWRQIKKSHPEHSALRNSIEADWITPITPHGITEFFQTMAPQHPRMIQMKASVNGAGTKLGETRVSPPALPKFHVRDRGHHGVSKRRRWPLFIFSPVQPQNQIFRTDGREDICILARPRNSWQTRRKPLSHSNR